MIFILSLLYACHSGPGVNAFMVDKQAQIKPDYSDLAIPLNIAPLNFLVDEPGESYHVKISSGNGSPILINSNDGIVNIPISQWKQLLTDNAGSQLSFEVFVKQEGKWKQFQPIKNSISVHPIDSYLLYRLLLPGYESWTEISIKQRNLETFDEYSIIENSVVDHNCVNCHSVKQGKSENFMFHMRGSMGGTYFLNSEGLKKFDLKTKEMKNGAIYPRWHPSGKYVAFSSNNIVQQFHSRESKKIEVIDLSSVLVLYDLEMNTMSNAYLGNDGQFMDTYPEWSPDGKYIYFSRATQIEQSFDYRDIKYDLYRAEFDASKRKFGNPELIFNASEQGKSASFARVSPDGKYLVFTFHEYGSFPIWHKDADLYAVNLESLETNSLQSNSNFAESYHTWSANSRWLVFSSKRDDGRTARPYIAYFDESGNIHKPFIMPQKDPGFYDHFLKTYNIPELTDSRIELDPGEARRVSEGPAKLAKWSDK